MNESHSPLPEKLDAVLERIQQRLDRVEKLLNIAPAEEAAVRPSPPPPVKTKKFLNIPPEPPKAPLPPIPSAAQARQELSDLLEVKPAPSALQKTLSAGEVKAPSRPSSPPPLFQEIARGLPLKKDVPLEQQLGTFWMLLAGVGVLLAAGVFFYQYAQQHNWIRPEMRVLGGLIAGAFVLALGEWSLRKNLKLFSAGLFGLGIVWLYYSIYVASPSGEYKLITHPQAFAGMCGITLLGMAMALRSGFQTSAIISVLGAFATPVLLSTGENHQIFLMNYMLIVNACFLGSTLVRGWRAVTPLLMLCTSLLFGIWFAQYYERDARAITLFFAWALAALPVIYAVLGLRWRRTSREDACGIILTAAALMTAVLNSTARTFDLTLALSFAVILAGVLLLELKQKLKFASTVAIGADLLLIINLISLGGYPQILPLNIHYLFLWMILLICLFFTLIIREEEQELRNTSKANLILIGSAMTALFLFDAKQEDTLRTVVLIRQFLLTGVVLAVCLKNRYHTLRIAVWAWWACLLAAAYLIRKPSYPLEFELTSAAAYSLWCWASFALLLADILIRLWWKKLESLEKLDAVLATLATGGMYALTYALLKEEYSAYMGAYTVGLGAAAVALAWLIRKTSDRRRIAYAYIGQGLVLITLAMPIQFSYSSLTIAWSVQALVSMFLAKRMGSRLLLIKSPVVFLLAYFHFINIQMLQTGPMSAPLWNGLGGAMTGNLLLGIGMVVCMLLAAGIGRAGKCISKKEEEVGVSAFLVFWSILASWIIAIKLLPPVGATWWVLLLAAVLGISTLVSKSSWLWVFSGISAIAAAVKIMAYDTLLLRLGGPIEMTPFWNAQLAASIALAVLCLVHAWKMAPPDKPRDASYRAIKIALGMAGILLPLWAISAEIDRYFCFRDTLDGPQWDDPKLALQMAYSLWWSLYAIALLVAGFLLRIPMARYTAMTVLAITLLKVLIVDMAGVDNLYRILAFFALGVIFLFGSLMYHRFFKKKAEELPGKPPGSSR